MLKNKNKIKNKKKNNVSTSKQQLKKCQLI